MINEIIHGDCLEVMREIPDKSIDMVLTDIPYGEVNRKHGSLRNISKGLADILTFNLREFLAHCNRVCKGNIYIFCGIEQISEIRAYFRESGLTTRNCVWEKTNPSPMNGTRLWLSSIENCVYARNPKSVHNEHCKGVVWRYPCGRSKSHPTEKPVKLFEYLINVSSEKGMIILDPCIGSGTTAIAAHNTNRHYIGIEKEEKYVNIARERIRQHTQQMSIEKLLQEV